MSTPIATQPSTSSKIRNNAAAAAAAASGGNPVCDICKRVGLPILPLRYAVVPDYVKQRPGNPIGWCQLGKSLQGRPAQLKGHHYVVRTLRKGYVMVYLGSGLWQAYAVNADGLLRKLADPDDPDHTNDRQMSAQCKREGHNVPASFINIPPVTSGGKRILPTKVWVAFSDVLWTRATRKQYEGESSASATLRAKRMQAFGTSELGQQADGLPDAFQLPLDEAATVGRLESLVVEYASDAVQADARSHYDASDPFRPKSTNRVPWQSAHGISMRTGQAYPVAKHLSKPTDKLVASAVVLDDPVGIVQELNATRLERIAARQSYMADARIARPLLISQSILGLKQLIGEQTATAITEEEKQKGLPDVQTEIVVMDPMSGMSQTTTSTRKERIDDKSTSLWSSLQKHYREADRAAFEKQVTATVKRFQSWLEMTDADYAYWLGQPDWLSRKNDHDAALPEHKDRLIEIIAAVLSGGPTNAPASGSSAPKDTQVYEVWKKFIAMKPADEANPIYVALFGHDEEILEYLLPDGLNPAEDKIHKGSKLYKVIKTIIGTKELTSNTTAGFHEGGMKGVLTREATDKVANPVRAAGAAGMDAMRNSRVSKAVDAVAESMLALGGALSRMAKGAVSDVAEATVMRAVQGAVLLYERREIYLVTSRLKVSEYIAYLNDMAFSAAQAGQGLAAKGVRSVTLAGKSTVRSMAIGGALRISDKNVRDAFIDVTHWAYDRLDGLGEAMDAVPGKQHSARVSHDAAQATRAAEAAAATAAMRVHPFTISPAAAEFVESVGAKASAAGTSTLSVTKALTRNSLRMVTTGSGLIAVGSLVVQGWSLKDSIKKADARFIASNEARVLVVAGSMGVLGAVGEVGGVAFKLMGAKNLGTVVGRVGGVVGAIGSIVEGVQASMAAVRSHEHGDQDAAVLYGLAAGALVAGGLLGGYGALTGAALLGPVGWALLLIAAGVALLYFAMKAEDSQAAIWLDRCYWGKGERYAGSKNELERPWSDRDANEELSRLNAIIIGLAGETGFNDDGWGFADWVWDTVKAKVIFPAYDANLSAYDWTLTLVGKTPGLQLKVAGEKTHVAPSGSAGAVFRQIKSSNAVVPSDVAKYCRNLQGPRYRTEGKTNETLVMEFSVEVAVKYFADVQLKAEYQPDASDPHGLASLLLSEKDW